MRQTALLETGKAAHASGGESYLSAGVLGGVKEDRRRGRGSHRGQRIRRYIQKGGTLQALPQ